MHIFYIEKWAQWLSIQTCPLKDNPSKFNIFKYWRFSPSFFLYFSTSFLQIIKTRKNLTKNWVKKKNNMPGRKITLDLQGRSLSTLYFQSHSSGWRHLHFWGTDLKQNGFKNLFLLIIHSEMEFESCNPQGHLLIQGGCSFSLASVNNEQLSLLWCL